MTDIDLVIAWDEGISPLERYGFSDIEYSRAFLRSPRKVFPRAQRFIEDTQTADQVQVLLLRNVIDSLKAAETTDGK
jgi:hypothetical protein